MVEKLVDNLAGLPLHDVERLTRQAIFNDGALTEDDLRPLLAAKYQLLNRGGTLSFEPDTARFAEVGGLKNLRRWILQRKAAFDGTAPDLDAPKGVLLLGVQGCGKSLAARAAAGVLGVPLVRLDFGALYSKWHGESEKNLRESLSSAEALAPCVLWLDEIEKALSSGDGDSGTSRRVLGAFLTWLAEQRARVFIVATANDITALPPELVRKGRFDEIFFVDLPTPLARFEIFGIHCKKRAVTISEQDMKALAAAQRRILRRRNRAGRGVRAVRGAYQQTTGERGAHRYGARRDQAVIRGHGRKDRRAARVGQRTNRSRRLNGDSPHFLGMGAHLVGEEASERVSMQGRVRFSPGPSFTGVASLLAAA